MEIEESLKLKKRKAWADMQDILDREIASEQRLANLVEEIIPDEKTRREPDFYLQEWRIRQQAIIKMKESFKRTEER